MIKLIASLLLFYMSSVSAIEVMQIKCVEKTYTYWGTAFCYNGHILTAGHCANHSGQFFLSDKDGKWIPCTVAKKDLDTDIALLTVSTPASWKSYDHAKGTLLFGFPHSKDLSVINHECICMSGTVDEFYGVFSKFSHGASGSPITKDGVLVGMAVKYVKNDKDESDTSMVDYVTVAAMEAFVGGK